MIVNKEKLRSDLSKRIAKIMWYTLGDLFCEYCGYRLLSELEIDEHLIICLKKKEHDSREEKLGFEFEEKHQLAKKL